LTITPDELAFVDAVEIARMVRTGEISAAEVVEGTIARIDNWDGAVRSVVIRSFDQARESAAAIDASGGSAGVLAGVPTLLKNLGATSAGIEATMGSKFLHGYRPDHDSELVRRLRAAGMIIVGKSNVPEFGILMTTEPVVYGATRNPFDPESSVGGSSGGAAAAVATGLVPVAHGNDGGGSIRVPAACCGVVGLKPTRARTPMGPDLGDLMNGIPVEFAMSRSVRDTAALLDVLAGPSPGDPYAAPPQPDSYLAAVDEPLDRLHIGLVRPIGASAVDPVCIEASAHTAALCEQLGHVVDEVDLPVSFADLADLFTQVFVTGLAAGIRGYAFASGREPSAADFEPLTWHLYERGLRVSGPDYLGAITMLQQASRRLAGFFADYDVTLSPTTAEPALKMPAFAGTDLDERVARSLAFAHDTPLANITGQPAISVPLYWTDTGLPVGSHLLGRFGDEVTLLKLARQLETAQPWRHHYLDRMESVDRARQR
jgi:amidase